MHVAVGGCRSDPALFEQIATKLGQHILDRRRRGGNGHRDRSNAAQVRKQRRHALVREPKRVASRAPRNEELLDAFGREIADVEALPDQPAADMGHQPKLIAHRAPSVALCFDLRTEPCSVGSKWTYDPDPRRIAHDYLLLVIA